MYDPSIGRWMQDDPMGFAAGDPNFYRVEGNDPVNRVDPTGLLWGHIHSNEDDLQWDALYNVQGKWQSDWYFDKVLGLWTWSTANAFGNSDDYTEFQRGCIGLCNVRLGLPYGHNDPWNSAEAGFKDFDSAMKYAQGLPCKSGKKVRIFAVAFKHMRMNKDEWNKAGGQITDFKNVVDIGKGGWDFLTLHQPTKDKSSWFWEDMEEGYDDKKHHDVEHFPFTRFLPENLKGYKYVVFYVVYAKDTGVLPPAQYNCGN